MMKVNRGKDFEERIKEAFVKLKNVSIDRLPDPMAGYMGIRNICDFIIYNYPNQIYLECKAAYGNTLNLKSRFTETQWWGLEEKSKIPGVIAGAAIWFIDHDLTIFVPIKSLLKLDYEGHKSLNIEQIRQNEVFHIKIPGMKRRVLYDYDANAFLKELGGYANGGK